eukprot:8336134-Lingulodinium_polyedra.AAC.1
MSLARTAVQGVRRSGADELRAGCGMEAAAASAGVGAEGRLGRLPSEGGADESAGMESVSS